MIEYRDLKGYGDKYKIDNKGNVINKNTGNALKTQISNRGYTLVELYGEGKRKKLSVHRLVAKVFIPNPKNKPEVNHKNGIKSDNRPENLKWSTRSENLKHAYDSGLKGKGNESPVAKLSKDQIIYIREVYAQGKVFQKDLAKIYDVSQAQISDIIRGIYWKDAGGPIKK